MKFKILAALVAAVSVPAAARVKPMTKQEYAKIAYYGQHPRLVDCMTVYKFDFFASQLGVTVNDPAITELVQLAQFRTFLNSGKLELKDPKMRFPEALRSHCVAVAQTAVEMLALKLVGTPAVERVDDTESN